MKFTYRRVAAAVTAAGLLMLAAPVHSASDGSLGATSVGTSVVTVTIPSMVRITGVANLTIASYSGPSAFASDSVCVYSNTGNYTVTMTSGEGSYVLRGVTDNTKTIGYSVEWAASSGASSGTSLTYNTASGTLAGSSASVTCGGGDNATLIVRVTDANVGTAPAQDYTDTLTITVAPV